MCVGTGFEHILSYTHPNTVVREQSDFGKDGTTQKHKNYTKGVWWFHWGERKKEWWQKGGFKHDEQRRRGIVERENGRVGVFSVLVHHYHCRIHN